MIKRLCAVCNKNLETQDRRIIVCSDKCRKLYKKEYQVNIPIELKMLYEKTYLSTEKGKLAKKLKNKRYRDKKKISQYNQIQVANKKIMI